MIAVQGPRAVEITSRLFRANVAGLRRYRAVITDQFQKPVIVSRTGYTGEDGFELIVRAEEATRVWENVLLAGRAAGFCAAGLGARDTLRLEASMPLYGHELSDQIDPISAGLGFACTLDPPRDFIGSGAIDEIRKSGPSRVRIGMFPEGKRPVREGCAVVDSSGRAIGLVTSGGPSPTLGKPIAMAMVDAGCIDATTGLAREEMRIDNRGTYQPTLVTRLPFYERPN
jgi:aminomethyltransferase